MSEIIWVKYLYVHVFGLPHLSNIFGDTESQFTFSFQGNWSRAICVLLMISWGLVTLTVIKVSIWIASTSTFNIVSLVTKMQIHWMGHTHRWIWSSSPPRIPAIPPDQKLLKIMQFSEMLKNRMFCSKAEIPRSTPCSDSGSASTSPLTQSSFS